VHVSETVSGLPHKVEDVTARFARCAPALRKFFARRVSVSAEADDLTQEVFTRVLRRAESGEPVENFEGYVFQIAANLLSHRARQDIRRRALNDCVEAQDWTKGGAEFTPERIVSAREECRQVMAALQELPERVRTVFVLNRFEELTGVEIARRLGISVSTVEKAMMRALAHLRHRLR